MAVTKFTYPMLVERGKVNGIYEILKTKQQDGNLFVFFLANGRIYVGITEIRCVIEHKTEIVLAKLAKEQNIDCYRSVVIGKPTRARSRAKIRPKQHSLDKPIQPETYPTEKYAVEEQIARTVPLLHKRKDRELAMARIKQEHKKEITLREKIESSRIGMDEPDTLQSIPDSYTIGGVRLEIA